VDAEAERDHARADREQADNATAQAITRMDALEHELAELRAATEAEVLSTRASAAADIQQAPPAIGSQGRAGVAWLLAILRVVPY